MADVVDQHAAQLQSGPARGHLRIRVHPPALVHRHRPAAPRQAPPVPRTPASQIREPGGRPQPPRRQARDLIHGLEQSGVPQHRGEQVNLGGQRGTVRAAPGQHAGGHRGHVRGAVRSRPSTCQPAAQRSGWGWPRPRPRSRPARRRPGPRSGSRNEAGSASTCSGSGRSISISQAEELHARPIPDGAPDQRRAGPRPRRPPRPPRPSGGLPFPTSGATASRGGRPTQGPTAARRPARAGRAGRRPPARGPGPPRPPTRRETPARPVRSSRPPGRRPPIAGRSARSGDTGGWPAARTGPAVGGLFRRVGRGHHGRPSGSVRSPTARSSTTRSSAACTAGGAVDSSSRNSRPYPAPASRRAQAGGANRTSPSATMGSPAKSDGSRIEAITVSQGRPMACAMARMADVLPVPGAPHSRTGTRAATATPSASAAGLRWLIFPSVAHPGHRPRRPWRARPATVSSPRHRRAAPARGRPASPPAPRPRPGAVR